MPHTRAVGQSQTESQESARVNGRPESTRASFNGCCNGRRDRVRYTQFPFQTLMNARACFDHHALHHCGMSRTLFTPVATAACAGFKREHASLALLYFRFFRVRSSAAASNECSRAVPASIFRHLPAAQRAILFTYARFGMLKLQAVALLL